MCYVGDVVVDRLASTRSCRRQSERKQKFFCLATVQVITSRKLTGLEALSSSLLSVPDWVILLLSCCRFSCFSCFSVESLLSVAEDGELVVQTDSALNSARSRNSSRYLQIGKIVSYNNKNIAKKGTITIIMVAINNKIELNMKHAKIELLSNKRRREYLGHGNVGFVWVRGGAAVKPLTVQKLAPCVQHKVWFTLAQKTPVHRSLLK